MPASERSARVLIAGLGNIFYGDDAFGVEVARRLALQPLPGGVRLVDAGLRSLHVGFELASGDGYDTLILIDAVARGGAPGTLYVMAPDDLEPGGMAREPHGVGPEDVLAVAHQLGGRVRRVFIIGCEPATFDAEELSAPVAAAVDEAARMVLGLCA